MIVLQACIRATRKALRFIGLDLHRYPNKDGLGRVLKLMLENKILTILDVGANDGGYAENVIDRGFKGCLISFEPISSVYQVLARKCTRHPNWHVYNCALGSCIGESILNIAANGGASSSFLKMNSCHADADPKSAYVGEEVVALSTLDHVIYQHFDGNPPQVFLKIDVQGYEIEVLKGAITLISHGFVRGIQIELSLITLYEESANWHDLVRFIQSFGFEFVFFEPGFSDENMYLLQVDAYFFRR